MYCQVIVDIVHENVARAFTYAIPEEMKVSPGQRVAVPFGSREKEGYVLALSEETEYDPGKIRAVKRTLEDYPAILPQMLDLAEGLDIFRLVQAVALGVAGGLYELGEGVAPIADAGRVLAQFLCHFADRIV